MIVAASTPSIEVSETQSGSRWTFSPAQMRDFALFASDSYQMVEDARDGVTIRAYFPAGYQAKGAAAIQTARQALEVFGEVLDYPYPYETFTLVYGTSYGSGMEFPALALLSVTSTEDDLIHEVAHQWFYAVVGSNSGLEPWLDESLATYCQLLYTARTQPETLEKKLIQFESLAAAPAHSLGRDAAALGEDYTRTVYWYGGVFLYRLEQVMGENFMEALREYVARFDMKEASTADWVRIFLRWSSDNTQARNLMDECLFPSFQDVDGLPCESVAPLLAACGLMEGTAEGVFSPRGTVTRAQAVTILYRLSGTPEMVCVEMFDDVPGDAWYARAVAWAATNGVSAGVGGQHFAPQRPVTQGEWMALLSRYWGEEMDNVPAGTPVLTRGELACLLEQALLERDLI